MNTDNFKIQIRKGLLEFCILQIISRNEVYTSDIIEELKNSKIIVVEGTVYPLLNRLKISGYIKYEWKESKQGPPRKYYSITESGINYIKELIVSWNEINSSVKKLLNTKK
ncbi:MAG: PadR family transcriptional regulator [Flavobacteriaceae bacterium]|nr:PadR family transcriptional regulator [Flavobacteriaceae bacterium]